MTASVNRRAFLTWIAAGLALVTVCVAAEFCLRHGVAWQCPVLAVLNIPCPSCGSTRAFAALSQLKFLEAVQFNPLLVLGTMAAPFAILAAQRPGRLSRWGWPLFFGSVVLNWLYLVFFLPR